MVLARALSARPVTPDVTMNPRMKTINPVTVKKSASVTVRTAPYPPSMGMPRSGIGASIFGRNFGIIGVCREAIRSREKHSWVSEVQFTRESYSKGTARSDAGVFGFQYESRTSSRSRSSPSSFATTRRACRRQYPQIPPSRPFRQGS